MKKVGINMYQIIETPNGYKIKRSNGQFIKTIDGNDWLGSKEEADRVMVVASLLKA